MEGPTPSRPHIAEVALADDGQQLADDGQQWVDDGQQPADDSMDSDDGEYEDNDGQSEVSEEEEDNENGENDEDVLEPGADDRICQQIGGHRDQSRLSFLARSYR